MHELQRYQPPAQLTKFEYQSNNINNPFESSDLVKARLQSRRGGIILATPLSLKGGGSKHSESDITYKEKSNAFTLYDQKVNNKNQISNIQKKPDVSYETYSRVHTIFSKDVAEDNHRLREFIDLFKNFNSEDERNNYYKSVALNYRECYDMSLVDKEKGIYRLVNFDEVLNCVSGFLELPRDDERVRFLTHDIVVHINYFNKQHITTDIELISDKMEFVAEKNHRRNMFEHSFNSHGQRHALFWASTNFRNLAKATRFCGEALQDCRNDNKELKIISEKCAEDLKSAAKEITNQHAAIVYLEKDISAKNLINAENKKTILFQNQVIWGGGIALLVFVIFLLFWLLRNLSKSISVVPVIASSMPPPPPSPIMPSFPLKNLSPEQRNRALPVVTHSLVAILGYMAGSSISYASGVTDGVKEGVLYGKKDSSLVIMDKNKEDSSKPGFWEPNVNLNAPATQWTFFTALGALIAKAFFK